MLAALGQVEMEAHCSAHRLWQCLLQSGEPAIGDTGADCLHEAQWNQLRGQVWGGSSGDLPKASKVLKESFTLSTF